MSVQDGLKVIQQRFVFVDKMVSALDTGLSCGKNVLLWGVGGHAKSEVAEAVTKLYSEKVFMKSFGIGSKLEDLLGYVNVAEMTQRSGKRIYDHETSFMNYDYAIFEELFDAPASVLESLKDIMTRKAYCVGSEVCYPSKTKVIVACTNHNPEEWASKGTPSEQASKKAFIARFPIKVKVEWPTYGQMEYMKMFNAIFKAADKSAQGKLAVVAEMAAKTTRMGILLSPRDARHIADVYLAKGINGVLHMGVPSQVTDSIAAREKEIAKDYEILEKLTGVDIVIQKLKAKINACTDVIDLKLLNQYALDINTKLGEYRAGEHAVQFIGKMRTQCLECASEADKRFNKYLVKKDELTKDIQIDWK